MHFQQVIQLLQEIFVQLRQQAEPPTPMASLPAAPESLSPSDFRKQISKSGQ
jgi:hypothetical protein